MVGVGGCVVGVAGRVLRVSAVCPSCGVTVIERWLHGGQMAVAVGICGVKWAT